jgi:hypothetical protein
MDCRSLGENTPMTIPRSVVGDFHRRHCTGSSILTCDWNVEHPVQQLAPYDALSQKFDSGIRSALSVVNRDHRHSFD